MPLKRFSLPKAIWELRNDPRVSSLSYDPSTGAFAVTFHKPQPVQPDFAGNSDEADEQPPEGNWLFALERFNASPKARGQ